MPTQDLDNVFNDDTDTHTHTLEELLQALEDAE
jgi:hypothetical protein